MPEGERPLERGGVGPGLGTGGRRPCQLTTVNLSLQKGLIRIIRQSPKNLTARVQSRSSAELVLTGEGQGGSPCEPQIGGSELGF